jgi:MFS family permease
MGVDAIAALVFGRLFDKYGIPILIAGALISALFAPLAFSLSFGLAMAGMVLWGIGMGAQESVLRAAIAELVPANRRGSAYGIFNTSYGVAWFLGSALMGVLYDHSLVYLVVFSILMQLASVPFLFLVRRELKVAPAQSDQ